MRLSIVAVSLVWCTSLALAQPGEPPPPPPAEAPPPPPVVVAPATVAVTPPATTVDKGTLEDANAGRVAIMPTALTPPAGTWSFEDWELFFVSASYGVTDQLVITGTAMVPITSDLYWGFISAKYQLLKQDRLRFAVQGGLAGVLFKDNTTTFDSMGNPISTTSSQTTSGADLAGALTYCLDDDCYSHVDGAVVAGFAHQSSSAVPVGFMGGLVARVGKRVRLILEADTAHVFGDISGQANGFLGWYGVRFTSRQIAVDLALVKPFCSNNDCTSDTLPLGFPFVTFAYRGLD
jgi:hypothetical protein